MFWVAGFFSNFFQIITIMYENCERKNLRFINKIRDFENFVVFWSKVNLPGIVLIDFSFNAFFTFFASNLEDTNQKKLAN